MMRQYKVEALVYSPKSNLDKDTIVAASRLGVQQKLDEYSRQGWKLVSTNATDRGFAVYIWLYFEKEESES